MVQFKICRWCEIRLVSCLGWGGENILVSEGADRYGSAPSSH